MASRILFFVSIMTTVLNLFSQFNQEPDLLRVTCYLPTGNRTASGCYPYEGICASNRANLGKLVAVFNQEMELIGIYECKDTGSAKRLRNGTAIDIFKPDIQSARAHVRKHGDYQYVIFIEKEGTEVESN